MADIGIMGGTFDPIHNGHLMLGKQAYEEYHLDSVWFMPSGQPPHKHGQTVTAAADRQAMVQLAIASFSYFTCSDFEIKREGNSYTAQTLVLLQKAYPGHRFYFIIGADSLYEIEHWYQPEQVMARTTLLVAGRSYKAVERGMDEQIAYLARTYQACIHRLHCDVIDISSHELREMAAAGKALDRLLPESVEAYIYSHNLYRT